MLIVLAIILQAKTGRSLSLHATGSYFWCLQLHFGVGNYMEALAIDHEVGVGALAQENMLYQGPGKGGTTFMLNGCYSKCSIHTAK